MENIKFIIVLLVILICTGHVFAETNENYNNIKRLPPRYSGDDIVAVVAKMKKIKSKIGSKSEFESSEEYKARVDKFANSTKAEKDLMLVIKPQNVKFEYDADTKELQLEIAEDVMGVGGFLLKNTDKKTGSYVATNGFGAKIKVTKFRRTIIKMIPEPNKSDCKFWGSNSDPTTNHLALTVDSEIARRMKNNLAVLYSANPAPPYFKHDDTMYPAEFNLKFHNLPVHVDSNEDIIYVDLNKITLFYFKTGEVYSEIDLNDLNCKAPKSNDLPNVLDPD